MLPLKWDIVPAPCTRCVLCSTWIPLWHTWPLTSGHFRLELRVLWVWPWHCAFGQMSVTSSAVTDGQSKHLLDIFCHHSFNKLAEPILPLFHFFSLSFRQRSDRKMLKFPLVTACLTWMEIYFLPLWFHKGNAQLKVILSQLCYKKRKSSTQVNVRS